MLSQPSLLARLATSGIQVSLGPFLVRVRSDLRGVREYLSQLYADFPLSVPDGERKIRVQLTEILAHTPQIGSYANEERSERYLDAGSRQASQQGRLRQHLEGYRSDEPRAIHERER